MDIRALKSELLRDEGCVLHAYNDALGFATIGVGRLIDARKNGRISHAEAMLLLGNDIATLEARLKARMPGWQGLDEVRQRALANMAFQLGVDGVLAFSRMLAAIGAQDWQAARAQCLDSRYARQTPARAARVAHMLYTGQTP